MRIELGVEPYEPTRLDLGIDPMGAVRTTRAMAGRTDAGQRYAAYKDFIALSVLQQRKNKEPMDAAIAVDVQFNMPIPKSLEGKVKPGQYHTKKPDIDNLVKGVFDAVNGLLWVDDNRVVELTTSKRYSDKPGIVMAAHVVGELAHGQDQKPKPTKKKATQTKRQERTRARRITARK